MNETTHSPQSMKNRFPFRVGTTSYILPADLLSNVAFLAPLVDDVELVLFESEEISNLPDGNVVRELDGLKRAGGITYTVHLPLDIQPGSPDENVRKRSVEKCLRVVEITRALDPFAYILHFAGERRGMRPAPDIGCWQVALERSVRDLLDGGLKAEDLCVETLDYPFELVAGIVFRNRLSMCIDVGHLLFHEYPVERYFRRYLERCRVLHLHGVVDGCDHRHIGMPDGGAVRSVLERLCADPDRERVLTIEVFSRRDLERSLEILEEFDRWRKSR